MTKYSVLLVTNDEVPVDADGVYVSDGALVFFKDGVKTEADRLPDTTTVMIFAAGTWTLVTTE